MKLKYLGLILLLGLIYSPVAALDSLQLNVQEFTLENGMHFLVLERHTAPVVSAVIRFKVGSVDEHPGITGIAHLCEHMMFKGTKLFGTSSYEAELPFMRKIDSLAALLTLEQAKAKNPFYRGTTAGVDSLKAAIHAIQLEQANYIIKDELWETYLRNGGGALNAFTGNDATTYFVNLPANRLELWALLESDRMTNLVTREYYSERDVVYEERRRGIDNEPGGSLIEQFNLQAFAASGYRWPVVGWSYDLETMTREDLENFYHRFYAPNNAIASIVGDVNIDEVKALAQKYFGPLQSSQLKPELLTEEPPQKGERRIKVEFDAQPQMIIGYHTVAAGAEDQPALDLIANILTSGRTSRLYKKMIEQEKVAVSVWCGAPFSRYPDIFMFWITPKAPATYEQNEIAVYNELEKLKMEPVSDWELRRFRNQLEAGYIRGMSSNLGMAFRLEDYYALTGDWRFIQTHYEMRRAVTPEDIMRVAKKYFTPENLTVAQLVKPADTSKAENNKPTE